VLQSLTDADPRLSGCLGPVVPHCGVLHLPVGHHQAHRYISERRPFDQRSEPRTRPLECLPSAMRHETEIQSQFCGRSRAWDRISVSMATSSELPPPRACRFTSYSRLELTCESGIDYQEPSRLWSCSQSVVQLSLLPSEASDALRPSLTSPVSGMWSVIRTPLP